MCDLILCIAAYIRNPGSVHIRNVLFQENIRNLDQQVFDIFRCISRMHHISVHNTKIIAQKLILLISYNRQQRSFIYIDDFNTFVPMRRIVGRMIKQNLAVAHVQSRVDLDDLVAWLTCRIKF